MPNTKNVAELKEIEAVLAESQAVVVASYAGLKVKDQVSLRAKIAEAGGQLKVNKNRLFKIAADKVLDSGKDTLTSALEGQNAFLYAIKDAVSPLKAIFEFAKTNEALKIKLGLMNGKVLSYEETESLSKLPSKPELIGQLIARLNGPAFNMVNTIQGPTRKLVYALKAIQDKKTN